MVKQYTTPNTINLYCNGMMRRYENINRIRNARKGMENGVNIATVCRSIMGEVKYVVTKNTGVEVREVNVFVDSITV